MSHLNSVRVPATIIFTALLIIILMSSSRTTYTLSPAKGSATLAVCDAQAAAATHEAAAEPTMALREATMVPREPAQPRVCPWPRRMRHLWSDAGRAWNDPGNDSGNDSFGESLAHAGPEHSSPRVVTPSQAHMETASQK